MFPLPYPWHDTQYFLYQGIYYEYFMFPLPYPWHDTQYFSYQEIYYEYFMFPGTQYDTIYVSNTMEIY